MKWTDEALRELNQVPEEMRESVRRFMQHYAEVNNLEEINAADLIKAREKESFMDVNPKKKHIAIVRCETVAEVCPGVACFMAFNARKKAFAIYGDDVEIIGFFTCGGCPGRRISRMIKSLKKYGLDAVHLSSCMLMDKPFPRCPYIDDIKQMIENQGIEVIEGTHH